MSTRTRRKSPRRGCLTRVVVAMPWLVVSVVRGDPQCDGHWHDTAFVPGLEMECCGTTPVNATVHALAWNGDSSAPGLLAGGFFTTALDQPLPYVGRWNGDG